MSSVLLIVATDDLEDLATSVTIDTLFAKFRVVFLKTYFCNSRIIHAIS